jgi:N-acyl-D-aspartate/D-glutamate deacylase
MLDLTIRNGMVVDGSGRKARRADVGILDGRVVAVGKVDDQSSQEIDADGRVVCPGFVDVHTHYDAQLFWDPTFSPSPLHGVTTVVAGNCGISLAPVGPDDQEFIARLLSRVEAIPLESLAEGLSFSWKEFPEFLDVVESMDLMVNVGFLVGHSALRRFVMGESASGAHASKQQLAAMVRSLDLAIEAGALGFSSSESSTQFDGDGRPTPPNFASDAELVALARVCGSHPGTSLEYVPVSAGWGFDDDEQDLRLLAAMSRAARRQVNWNSVLLRYPGKPDIQDRQLDSADFGREDGATIVPMIIPHNFRVRTDLLQSDVGFRTQPGFEELFDLPPAQRLATLKSPEVRADLKAQLHASDLFATVAFRGSLGEHVVSDVGPPDMQRYVGRTVSDIAQERRSELLDVMLDLATEASLDIGFTRHVVPIDTAEERALRRRVLRDPRVVLGASDGGAHVRGVINTEYSTASFAELVRDDDIFTVEELVQEFTDIPARLYGLKGRGRLQPGAYADVVIFDPDTIGTSPVSLREDLPGGAPRLFSSGVGISSVLVGGEEVVRHGEFTERRPGQLLRSGRDSATVPRNQLRQRHRTT